MRVESFIRQINSDFYTGVPDSQLKEFCDYLMDCYGIDKNHHVIAANEGNCTALAAGYHLATGKVPVVYMQNSGEGNMINPVASLLRPEVYGIPVIFVIGWRGEPGVQDEPQHIFQGRVTVKLMDDMQIPSFIIDEGTTEDEVASVMRDFHRRNAGGESVAFIVRKGAFQYRKKKPYGNENLLNREEVIRHVVRVADNDVIVSTTGKASRELFETRAANGQGHQCDFMTVGSMGHASSIALGIAIQKPNARIWCIDGDGAMIMHMGALAVIGSIQPSNFIHIVINNSAHESVGGMPTVSSQLDVPSIARSCGYPYAVCVNDFAALDSELAAAKNRGRLSLIEVRCALGSRKDLGRPTTTPLENKREFMDYLKTI